eukprot:SAG31_NODE_5103_length_2742_cov_5.165721_1_plen_60_part_00
MPGGFSGTVRGAIDVDGADDREQARRRARGGLLWHVPCAHAAAEWTPAITCARSWSTAY